MKSEGYIEMKFKHRERRAGLHEKRQARALPQSEQGAANAGGGGERRGRPRWQRLRSDVVARYSQELAGKDHIRIAQNMPVCFEDRLEV